MRCAGVSETADRRASRLAKRNGSGRPPGLSIDPMSVSRVSGESLLMGFDTSERRLLVPKQIFKSDFY
jgi:hypothetical protein